MLWIDIMFLGIVAASVLFGLLRGAIRTVFSIVGVVAGFWLATRESGAVGVVLSRWLPEQTAAAVGFLAVFFGVALVFTLSSWLLRKLLSGLSLSWLDRLSGAAVGLARGLLITGVMALGFESLGLQPPAESWSYPHAMRAGKFLLEVVPEDTLERLKWDRLKDWMPGGQLSDDSEDGEFI